MGMSDIVQYLGAWLETSRYALLFWGAIIEGPIITLTSGFLFHLKQLDFLPMFIALAGGDLLADMVWYGVGYFAAQPFIAKYGKFLGVTQEVMLTMEERFKEHQNKILIISKLTMGLGFALATLMAAGMLKVPLKKFFVINLFCGLIWTGLLITVGFFFGNIYTLVADELKVVFVIAIAIAAIFGIRLMHRSSRRIKI